MNTMVETAPREESAQPNKVPFKILLAYDSLDNGRRGKECCERLLRDFKNRYSRVDAYISILKLGLLCAPSMLEKWHRAALEADLVLLSVQHETPLPDFVKRWTTGWMNAQHEKPVVLVALLNRRKTDFIAVSPVQRYLLGLVRNENIALFTLFQECKESLQPCQREMIRHRTHYLSQTLLDATKPHACTVKLHSISPPGKKPLDE